MNFTGSPSGNFTQWVNPAVEIPIMRGKIFLEVLLGCRIEPCPPALGIDHLNLDWRGVIAKDEPNPLRRERKPCLNNVYCTALPIFVSALQYRRNSGKCSCIE